MSCRHIPGDWRRGTGRRGSETELPELALPWKASMKPHLLWGTQQVKGWTWCYPHDPRPPHMSLTSRAMTSSSFPPGGSLVAIPLPVHSPTMGAGKPQPCSRALPPPSLASTQKGQWGPAKTTSRTGQLKVSKVCFVKTACS